MIRNFHKTCIGFLCAISASYVSANDCCYDICDTDYGTFGVHAEYLFWRTEIPCLDYAQHLTYPIETITVDSETEQRLGTLLTQDISHVNHKWRSGFRAGVDYKCSLDDPWRYAAYYTYYRSHDDAKRFVLNDVANLQSFLVPSIPFYFGQISIYPLNETYVIVGGGKEGTAIPSAYNHTLEAADSKTHLRLDFGDAEVTRINCLCGPATFNVLVGIRGGYIRNHWDTTYFFLDDASTDRRGFRDTVANVKNHWTFLSIGPRIGGQFDWFLGYGFSLYVDASASALWGKVKNRVFSSLEGIFFENTQTPTETPFFVIQENLCRHRRKAVPLLQGEAGLAWFMTCENFVVDAKVGVELMHFVNLAENFNYPTPIPFKAGTIRSIDLYGLTVGVGVLF